MEKADHDLETIRLKKAKVADKADVIKLSSENLAEVNSFDNQRKIYPVENQIDVENDRIKTGIDPYTFLILKIGLKQ